VKTRDNEPDGDDTRRQTVERLERIAEVMPDLLAFATARLGRLGLSAHLAEDLVAHAIERIVVGMDSLTEGRRPKPEDLISDEAWTNYLKGAINSVLEAWTRKRKRSGLEQASPFEDNTTPARALTAPSLAVDREVERTDYQQVFIGRMRRLAPAHLQATIDQWSLDFWSGGIPVVTSHDDRRQVQALARTVYAELNSWV
jgi:DNA-directed RNA polymerase specialized sigma24 family protein